MAYKIKKHYGIEWTNTFGKRVLYPEQVFSKKPSAEKFAIKLAYDRLKRTNTIMKDIKIVELY
jgi:hypothetical protein